MRIALIGGAGARAPLLVGGLCRSELPIDELALYDPDQARLATMGALAQRVAGAVPVRLAPSSAEAIAGADYVLVSIRPGGIAARAHDEQAALRHGVIGQETVGPAGFAMALRTIPELLRYAREVEALAPRAWLVSFTNPVGIVTQAVRAHTGARVIGICDTPTELFEEVAHLLGLESSRCRFDYLGLNHLGWLREVYDQGEPQLARLFARPELLARVHRAPLFAPAFLAELRLLPTEYLYYYYRSADALANVRRAGQTRGQAIAALNAALDRDLATPGVEPVAAYERYLAARDGGYLQLESGAAAPIPRSPWAALTGYDRIALALLRAIHHHSGALLPLDVRNGGALADLDDDDVVEVPCVVDRNGPAPLAVGRAPAAIRPLLVQVKEYERLTVRAAVERSPALGRAALAANPLVPSPAVAARLYDELALP